MESSPIQDTADSAVCCDNELLAQLRRLKTTVLISKILTFFIPVAGFAAVAYIASLEAWVWMMAAIALSAILCFGAAFIWGAQSKKLKVLLGQSVTMPVVQEVFDVAEYRPERGIESRLINAAGLIYDWDTYSGNDFVRGRYKGMGIMYSDIHLQREEEDTDEDGKRTKHYVTVFKGQWMICDFGKQLSAALRLRENPRINLIKAKSDIETESPEFNKKYRIITSDGHTAFYVLTPHFIEYILAADELARARTYFCFEGSQVHIAIDSRRDSLELKRVRLHSVENIREKFRSELKYVTDILDVLLCNEKMYRENI